MFVWIILWIHKVNLILCLSMFELRNMHGVGEMQSSVRVSGAWSTMLPCMHAWKQDVEVSCMVHSLTLFFCLIPCQLHTIVDSLLSLELPHNFSEHAADCIV